MASKQVTPEQARNLVADALESGRFEQGKFVLEENGKNCCLGVACRVYMENGGELKTTPSVTGCTFFNNNKVNLPREVKEWLGFRTASGGYAWDFVYPHKPNESLIRHNDTGMPFSDIAELFRNPPEGLLNE